MSKLLCFIFGHIGVSYNCGTGESPEEGWMCANCGTELQYGDEHWGIELNNRITRWFYERSRKDDDSDLPF